MNVEASFKSFLAWIVAGMGLHVGWGLISLLIDFAAKAVSKA
jgi:hypothetical protein